MIGSPKLGETQKLGTNINYKRKLQESSKGICKLEQNIRILLKTRTINMLCLNSYDYFHDGLQYTVLIINWKSAPLHIIQTLH